MKIGLSKISITYYYDIVQSTKPDKNEMKNKYTKFNYVDIRLEFIKI